MKVEKMEHFKVLFQLLLSVIWRREWQPTAAFLPGKSHGQRSLVATVLGVAKSQTRLSTAEDKAVR